VDDLISANSSGCSTTPIAYLRGQQNIFTASCQASSFLVHIRTDSTNDDMCSVQLEGNVVAFENASIHTSFTLDKPQQLGSDSPNSTRSFVVSVVIIDAASSADSVPTETSCRPLVSSFVLSVPPGMELPHQISICKVKATEADGKFLSFSIVAAGSLRSLDSYVIKVECSHLYFSVMDVAIGSMSDIDLSVVNTQQQQQQEMRSMTMRIFKNSLVRAVTVSDRGVAAVTFDSKVVFLDIDDDNDEDDEEEDDGSDS
jgi:phosphoribosylformylglycinamidine (FGAM) synthase PurS component